jgi:hypothetical protein
VLFYDKKGFTRYLGWEELRRLQAAHAAKKPKQRAKKAKAA